MSHRMFRNIPSVNELLDRPELKRVIDRVNRNVVVSEVRSFLDNMRSEIQTATGEIKIPAVNELAEKIATWIATDQRPRLRPVINATGIILHTGLGRAPLADEALSEIAAIGAGYATLEVDAATGQRSQRVQGVARMLVELTGAEAAVVVNNNAAATLLTLSTLAAGKEAVVSRGELIEIGGSYRLPDVMRQSGTVLREVGTTNKTRISDYRDACGSQTGAILRVHTSNYQVVGFTESPTLKELTRLSREQGIPLVDDIGSGALIDFSKYGLKDEPIVSESIKAGADLVLLSGDKLLGGPQCGIIVGRQKLVNTIVAHPLMRAMRVDKITLAALAATLRLYHDLDQAEAAIPLLRLLAAPLENLHHRSKRLVPQLQAAPLIAQATAVESTTYLGGGSVPNQSLPTWCVSLTPHKITVDQLASRLRAGTPSVFGRIQKDRLLLDLRSVLPDQDSQLVTAVTALYDEQDDPDEEINITVG